MERVSRAKLASCQRARRLGVKAQIRSEHPPSQDDLTARQSQPRDLHSIPMIATRPRPLYSAILLSAVFAYILFGVGRAVGVGLCFEADGHVEIEVMRAGSCTPTKLALDKGHEDHHAEHAGAASDEHCASCTDVSLPMRELRAKRVTGEQGAAAPIPVLIPLTLVAVAHSLPVSQTAYSHSPVLPSLSTIVLRT